MNSTKKDSASAMPPLKEEHFFHHSSQTNVYGTTTVCLPNLNKLLIATSAGIHSLEYQRTEENGLKPVSKRIQFTYIPAEAEIVSIDAFNRRQYGEGLVIGICFIKDAEGSKPSQFLNIYTATEPGGEFNLDSIANGCRDHSLPYFPYQLFHADLFVDGIHEVAFLLSGSDQSVHLFREDRLLMNLGYSEQPVDIFFPEFAHFNSNVLWMDVRYSADYRKRFSVAGTQNGGVKVSVVDAVKRVVLRCYDNCHDSPITSVKLFGRLNDAGDVCRKSWAPLYYDDEDNDRFPDKIMKLVNDNEARRKSKEGVVEEVEEAIHLLVSSALEPTVVYSNIASNGLEKDVELPESNLFDCVLGSSVSDMDMDGEREISLCTYGQMMMTYKLKYCTSSLPGRTEEVEEAVLLFKSQFAYPLLGMKAVDIVGDGVVETILVSVKGLHVLRHESDAVVKLLKEKLKRLQLTVA